MTYEVTYREPFNVTNWLFLARVNSKRVNGRSEKRISTELRHQRGDLGNRITGAFPEARGGHLSHFTKRELDLVWSVFSLSFSTSGFT